MKMSIFSPKVLYIGFVVKAEGEHEFDEVKTIQGRIPMNQDGFHDDVEIKFDLNEKSLRFGKYVYLAYFLSREKEDLFFIKNSPADVQNGDSITLLFKKNKPLINPPLGACTI